MCINNVIVLHLLGIFLFYSKKKFRLPGSNSRPNVSEGYMVTSELPGRPASTCLLIVLILIVHYRAGININSCFEKYSRVINSVEVVSLCRSYWGAVWLQKMSRCSLDLSANKKHTTTGPGEFSARQSPRQKEGFHPWHGSYE